MTPKYKVNWWTLENESPKEAMLFIYSWMYLRNGKTGKGGIFCMSELIFYKLVNKWNQDEYWKYWSV